MSADSVPQRVPMPFMFSLSLEMDYKVGPRLRVISVLPCLTVAQQKQVPTQSIYVFHMASEAHDGKSVDCVGRFATSPFGIQSAVSRANEIAISFEVMF